MLCEVKNIFNEFHNTCPISYKSKAAKVWTNDVKKCENDIPLGAVVTSNDSDADGTLRNNS